MTQSISLQSMPLQNQTYTYHCEIVTPMFLGGANPVHPELRSASIKSRLRFWWRALYGSSNLKQLIQDEAEIFGSTENRSAFSIHTVNQTVTPTSDPSLKGGKIFQTSSKGESCSSSILDYLAFGPVVHNKKTQETQFKRKYLVPGSQFDIEITIKKPGIKQQLLNSLEAWLKFGGLGAKERNGFGSVISSKENERFDISSTIAADALPYARLSKKCHLYLFPMCDTWQDALSDIGLAYRKARLSLEPRHYFSKRGLLARPIIAKGENIPAFIHKGRRAKPLFLKVNKLPNGKYQGQILVVPVKVNKQHEYDQVIAHLNREFDKEAISGGKL
ncbi:MAG: type III-B CRISPR module RAMP protein Cmr1 [Acidobacteria bacterium]|nr:MAG: type III-B CRISPR module RAMP protein Cmr1 [Acidobacteriota bacterium]